MAFHLDKQTSGGNGLGAMLAGLLQTSQEGQQVGGVLSVFNSASGGNWASAVAARQIDDTTASAIRRERLVIERQILRA